VSSPRSVESFELELTLRDVEPPVWRRIVVPQSVTLHRLHGLIQAAMGWENSHLHLFAIDGRDYGDPEDGDDMGDLRTRLSDVVAPGSVFRYDYDFGDGWEHDVQVLGTTTSDEPRCLDGARACPPEDCGGPPGYEDLLEVLADPEHPDNDDLRDWLGSEFDPEVFDVAAADAAVRSVAR
jgi:hypothetical protein